MFGYGSFGIVHPSQKRQEAPKCLVALVVFLIGGFYVPRYLFFKLGRCEIKAVNFIDKLRFGYDTRDLVLPRFIVCRDLRGEECPVVAKLSV